ncbi:MAG TPA: hypothetical protein VK191_16485 [Symbiobacteriaceae bacterium]|nr:hypothetical protein [Symbiobacteriaceae bacterium]
MSDRVKEQVISEVEPAPLPSGPAGAAILAAGIGSAWYGFLVVLVEASPAVKSALTLNNGVGPLSGKTTFGSLGFIAAWLVLAQMWKGKDVTIDKLWKISLGLIILGLIFTFPPFFQLFTAH